MDYRIPTVRHWCDNCQDFIMHYKMLGEITKGYCEKCGTEKR